MKSAFEFTLDNNGIARVVFDLPDERINKLSLDVLSQLEKIVDELEKNPLVEALVLTSGKEGVFIAGADLKSFDAVFKNPALIDDMIGTGHRVFNKLEALPFPTFALINGACLGGGLELALSCTFRLVGDSPKTSLGLPETTLGIYPGWGGTQRLPRLVGFTQGLTMILTGQSVDAQKAFKIKLADAIFPSEFFYEQAEGFIKKALTVNGKKEILQRRRITGPYAWIFEKNPLGRAFVCWQAKRETLKKTKGHYPAPLAAIKAVRQGYGLALRKGLKKEKELFLQAAASGDFRHSMNLIHLFFSSEAIKKDSKSHTPFKPRSVGILGAGTMGSGIAWLFSYKEMPARVKDVSWDALGRGCASAWETYKTLMRIRKLKPTQANMKFHRISGTTDYSGFDKADLIIEAAAENLELKHRIFSELEAKVSPKAIIATNTSSYTIGELSRGFRHPERLVGMHFFNPPSRMPLVEVVAGAQTSPETVAAAVAVCRELNKTPVVVGDCTGFLVNRIFVRGFSEVMEMLNSGIRMTKLDEVLVRFGLPMAPFVLADEVGNDVNLKVFQSLAKAYPNRVFVPQVLEKMNALGFLGKKTGKGFYIHKGKKNAPNSEVQSLLPTGARSALLGDQEIIDRLTLGMIHEASLCLQEKIVSEPSHLDVAMVFGTGFPPFRGGLLRYADSLGSDTVVSKLKQLEERVGERFSPTELLQDLARRNLGFYSLSGK